VAPHQPHERTAASLPTGLSDRGRWQQFAGSASGLGLSGNPAGAIEPSLATGPAGQVYTAWTDVRNGNFEVYLAAWTGRGWPAAISKAASARATAARGGRAFRLMRPASRSSLGSRTMTSS
jgi:hypothetical protein